MCQRGGPSIAAFLQQAEENLALLGARGDGAWPPQQTLRSPFPRSVLATAAATASAASEAAAAADRGRHNAAGQPLVQRGNIAALSKYEPADSRTRSSGSRQRTSPVEHHSMDTGFSGSTPSRPRLEGRNTTTPSAVTTPPTHGLHLSGLDDPEGGDDPRTAGPCPQALESWAEAKEQMDVQAKTMLGLDRRVRGFDTRIRAVEAAVAAVSDIATEASKSGGNLRERAVSPADGHSSSEAMEPPKRSASRGKSPGASPRQKNQQQQQQQNIADLQRRLGALSDSARKDREALRSNARRAADTYAEEIKRSLDLRFEAFGTELREREQRQLDRLNQEVQRHAERVGKDVAGELLRGPVSDLVDRRSRDSEQQLRQNIQDLERELTGRLRILEQFQYEEADRMEQLVQDRVLSAIAVEGGLGDVADDAHVDERESHGRRLPASTCPGGLLRRTVESVAELQARANTEERTYWETVQSLDLRVADLEDALAFVQNDSEKEKVLMRRRLVVLEKADKTEQVPDSRQAAASAASVIQDQAGYRKHFGAASPRNPRTVSMEIAHQLAMTPNEQGHRYGPESGLHITPRQHDHEALGALRRPGAMDSSRQRNAANAVMAVTARARRPLRQGADDESPDELTFDGNDAPLRHGRVLDRSTQLDGTCEDGQVGAGSGSGRVSSDGGQASVGGEMHGGSSELAASAGGDSRKDVGALRSVASDRQSSDQGSERRAGRDVAEQPMPPKPSASFPWPARQPPTPPESELPAETEEEAAELRAARAWLAQEFEPANADEVASRDGGSLARPAEKCDAAFLPPERMEEELHALDELPPAPGSKPADSWACPACTLINALTASECSACGGAAPPAPTPEPVSEASPRQPSANERAARTARQESPQMWDEILAGLGDEAGSGSGGQSLGDFRSDDDLPI